MEIIEVKENAEEYLDMLSLSVSEKKLILKHIKKGSLFVVIDKTIKGEFILSNQNNGIYQLQKIAIVCNFQENGYLKALIDNIFDSYPDCRVIYFGIKNLPLAVPFYNQSGLKQSNIVKNFLVNNFNRPVFRNNKQVADMVFLRKDYK